MSDLQIGDLVRVVRAPTVWQRLDGKCGEIVGGLARYDGVDAFGRPQLARGYAVKVDGWIYTIPRHHLRKIDGDPIDRTKVQWRDMPWQPSREIA